MQAACRNKPADRLFKFFLMASLDQIKELKTRIQSSIIGQEDVITKILIGLLTDGNVLSEGLPGLAKTRAVKSLARHLDCKLSRIRFTPDLLPSDITGTEIYQPQSEEKFIFQAGPIFSNLVLADEINRAPAKVQSALLEAMEERQVCIGYSEPRGTGRHVSFAGSATGPICHENRNRLSQSRRRNKSNATGQQPPESGKQRKQNRRIKTINQTKTIRWPTICCSEEPLPIRLSFYINDLNYRKNVPITTPLKVKLPGKKNSHINSYSDASRTGTKPGKLFCQDPDG
jgi:hypothetical protein